MTTTNIYPITREEKKLFKNADSVSFKYTSEKGSYIQCRKEIKVDGYKTDVFEKIPVNTNIRMYEKCMEDSCIYEVYEAFCSISFSKHDLTWQSIVKSMKPNDEIILEWFAGNNSNILNENNLSNDELHLIVKRNGKKELSFIIDKQITYKDSLARMVKLRKDYL